MLFAGLANTYHLLCKSEPRIIAICVSGKYTDDTDGISIRLSSISFRTVNVGMVVISYESFTGGMVPSGCATIERNKAIFSSIGRRLGGTSILFCEHRRKVSRKRCVSNG